MERKIVLKQDILDALLSVGVSKGQTIMVHTSLSSLGFVCGGAQMVIEALIEAVGNEGTIMMPTQSWKNLDPTTGVHWEEPEDWWQLIRDNWPAYNIYNQIFLTFVFCVLICVIIYCGNNQGKHVHLFHLAPSNLHSYLVGKIPMHQSY